MPGEPPSPDAKAPVTPSPLPAAAHPFRDDSVNAAAFAEANKDLWIMYHRLTQ